MPRFYLNDQLNLNQILLLNEDISHHIQVLRLQIGQQIEIFNGQGSCFLAEITQLNKKATQVRLLEDSSCNRELSYPVTLVQALPESNKLDWIIEKAVELGVTKFQAISAQRSVVKLNPERAEKKWQHWQAIAISASEQSGRNHLMQVSELNQFKQYLTTSSDAVRIMLSPRGDLALMKWVRSNPPQALELLIGPEGGFSPEEEELAAQHGVLLCTMGARILRTETAGLAAISAINGNWGGYE